MGKKKPNTVKVTKPQLWLCQNTQKLPGRVSSSAIYLQSWLCLHQSTCRDLSHPHPSRHPFTGIYTRRRQPEPSPPHKSLLACFGIQFLWVLLLWLWKMEEVERGAPLIICLNNTGNLLLGNRGVREDDDSLPNEQRTWLMTQPWHWGSPSHKTRQNKREGQRQGSCQAEEHRRLTRRCNCTYRESWSSSWICWVREKSSPGK